MTSFRCAWLVLALAPATSLLSSCGGGGGGSGGTAPVAPVAPVAPPIAAPSTTWVQGQFSPQAKFAALCVTPRTGIDPVSQQAYADRQGNLLDELNWLRSWINDLYLWYGAVPDQNPANFTTDAAYFAVLKTTATTASGNPEDRFHFTYPTAVWESLEQSGVEAGYGADFVILSGTPPRNVVVAYTEPGSQAAMAPASLGRGAKLLAIDGVDLVNANDQASVDTLNAGLSPQTVGETHTFSVLDPGLTNPRTVTLVSGDVTVSPVQNVHTIATAAGNTVGYMLFNDHLATAESALVTAFTQLQNAGVQDLVLDIRYNGGGLLDIASEVAYMIAGPNPTSGQTFEVTQFNDKYLSVDPVTGTAITPLGFHATAQGFSVPVGTVLPTLNLPRVFVLTGSGTCSASESIINSLQGVNVQVIQIGSTTCGKPYGFYPADNCGTTYFSIQFRGLNAKNFGDYTDGFTPANTMSTQGVPVPGCSVADDFTHALGDSAEGLLASALAYQASGVCPVAPSGVVVPPALAAGAYVPPMANGRVVKSLWQQNRIPRRSPPR
jgi:carboxyl-terminal processing protease